MFPLEAQFDGVVLDEEYVNQRIRWEPLYEITQIKGDGEAHPFLSPDDEFADYETWDSANLDGSVLKENDMLAGEYGREALKRGMTLETRFGTNPYKFGLVGSTDNHTSLATTAEDNFFGKSSTMEPGPKRSSGVFMATPEVSVYYRQNVASGLAGVWATENTREQIYDVACSGDRTIVDRRCNAPVGNTVDVETATYTNTIGNAALKAIWTDPDFDADQKAFYYVRVLEIPTPRWTTYDAVRYGLDLPDDVPASQQDRVYTSPIWYTP